MSSPDIESRLIDAIYAHGLAPACRDLADVSELARQGLATTERIMAETAASQAEVIAALAAAGVAATAGDPAAGAGGQYHAFDLNLAPDAVPAALAAMAGLGYPLAGLFRGGRATALARLSDALALMRDDDVSTRCRLVWRDRGGRPAPLAKFRPAPKDFAMLGLPGPLWPLYLAAKPARAVLERLTGRDMGDAKGLYSGAVNLGTPRPLIAPLLELAGAAKGELAVDLGCGDGRVLVEAARIFGCRGLGVERNGRLAAMARRNVEAAGFSDRVEIVEGEAATVDLSAAALVFLFLPASVLPAALAAALRDMKPGGRILAHEQVQLDLTPAPALSRPVFAENALTVAHLWRV